MKQNRRKQIAALFVSLSLCLACSACGQTATSNSSATAQSSTAVLLTAPSVDDMFTARDYEIGYSDYCTITLSDDASSADGDGVAISENTITITSAGTYVLTGSLSDGQIIVDVGDEEKVQLVLSNANVTCSGSAALYCRNADKVFVTTAENTENSLCSVDEFASSEESNIDAAIFAKCDLTLNGSGTLNVSCTAGHGIVSKDDLVITSGDYCIEAAKQGLSGKDSVRIAGGNFTITSGTDGIHSENDTEDEGFIFISGGTFLITSSHDGIDASGAITIEDGDFTINAGGGNTNATKSHTDTDFGPRPEDRQTTTDSSASDTDSDYKGIKSDTSILITDGTFTIDASDDAVHTNGSILISDGTLILSSGDDGTHADETIMISDGNISILTCYEGIEGAAVEISGGEISILATDDGINAADGTSSVPSSASSCSLTISGGTISINAEGDGLDSNGDLTVTGGTILIDGPSNGGNGAIDYDGNGTITGGTVIALDQPTMAMNFGSNSTQCTALISLDSQQTAGIEISLTDADGTVLLSYTSQKAFQSVLVSCSDMTTGNTYTLTAGSEIVTIEMTDTVYGASSSMGGMGDMGNMSGGGNPGDFSPDQKPEQGTPPDGSGQQPDNMQTPPDQNENSSAPQPPQQSETQNNTTT